MAAGDKLARPWWPPNRRTMIWGAVGLVVVGGTLFFAARAMGGELLGPKLPLKGAPACPPTPAPTAGLRPADYVILVLQNRDETFQELVWGQVLSRSPEGDEFLVRLLGTTGEAGGVELEKAKHGYRIGDQLKVDAACVWDTMAMPDVGGKGHILCGFEGEEVTGTPPAEVGDLRTGDQVQIVVSTLVGTEAHADPLWVSVDGISRTGYVVYGTIHDKVRFPMHGFRQWQKIQFGKDCIFAWRRP